MKRILTVYYSHSSNTRKMAEMLGRKAGGELLEIVPQKAYPSNYDIVVTQAKQEIQAGYRPALATALPDDGSFDILFVGTPNWWSTLAPPVAAFLEELDVRGKTVIPFCTHGGGGFGHIQRDVEALCTGAQVLPGLAVYGGSCREKEIESFINTLKL